MKIYEISESDREEILRLIRSRSYMGARNSLMQLQESKGLVVDFIKIIMEDMDYQRSQLTGDYEKDKPIKWRLLGFEEVLKKFEGLKK